MSLIPKAAKIIAALAFVVIIVALFICFDGHKSIGFGTALGVCIGSVVAGFILLAGYVYADAARRGMPPWPWTLLAVLIPNAVGFVLYFLLRKPILHPCTQCGSGIAQGAAFCSACGHSQP